MSYKSYNLTISTLFFNEWSKRLLKGILNKEEFTYKRYPRSASMNLEFYNILVSLGTIRQIQMFLTRSCIEQQYIERCPTHRICLYSLEHGLGTYCFRPTWPFLIAEVLANRENLFNNLVTRKSKSIQPSG